MAGAPPVAVLFVVVTILLAALVSSRVEMTRAAGGRVLAFIALFVLPVLAARQGFTQHMEQATTTSFCLSCHVMEPFGRSLQIDDPSFVPATHYQNHLVPVDRACFTCHTTYTLFGDYEAKLRGLRHLYVQYLGRLPKPEDIRLYSPYNNRECLHCHADMRKYEEAEAHRRTPEMLGAIASNRLSCTASNCHEFVHDVGHLQEYGVWKGAAAR